MKTATVAEARDDFRKLLDFVRNGESVEITDDGRPVARLVPTAEPAPRETEDEMLDRLEREGIIRRGSGERITFDRVPDDVPSSGVLDALLEERGETEDELLDRLAREGVIRRGKGEMPVIPPPADPARKSGVLDALLEERREGR